MFSVSDSSATRVQWARFILSVLMICLLVCSSSPASFLWNAGRVGFMLGSCSNHNTASWLGSNRRCWWCLTVDDLILRHPQTVWRYVFPFSIWCKEWLKTKTFDGIEFMAPPESFIPSYRNLSAALKPLKLLFKPGCNVTRREATFSH